MKKILVSVGLAMMVAFPPAYADLVQQFKDPTFSGNGWTTQVLTLEQMRQSNKASNDAKAASEAASAIAAASNTPLAKFLALFQGQVYSQLATQLTNNLFQSCTGGAVSCSQGQFNVTNTQQIAWTKDLNAGTVTLNVWNGTANSDGSFTRSGTQPLQTIIVPISQFSF
jgi:opacity protein-like surface antigen